MNRWDGYGELYHHGILGQKWGIRRYQNEDGTLTDEGKIRYKGSEGRKKYKKETLRDIKKDVNSQINKEMFLNKEANKLSAERVGFNAAVAGVVGAMTALLNSAGFVMIAPKFTLATAVTTTMYNLGVQDEMKNECAKALGYSGYDNMLVSEYNKRGEAAKYKQITEEMLRED
jgi:hypothetical protein